MIDYTDVIVDKIVTIKDRVRSHGHLLGHWQAQLLRTNNTLAQGSRHWAQDASTLMPRLEKSRPSDCILKLIRNLLDCIVVIEHIPDELEIVH